MLFINNEYATILLLQILMTTYIYASLTKQFFVIYKQYVYNNILLHYRKGLQKAKFNKNLRKDESTFFK